MSESRLGANTRADHGADGGQRASSSLLLAGPSKEELTHHVRPPVEFCEVDPMQTESLASKITCICLYLRAHARALRHIRVFRHMHAI